MNNSKRIVITGANGGVGRSLIDKFAKEGWQIIAITRNPKELSKYFDVNKHGCYRGVDTLKSKIVPIKADIKKYKDLEKIFNKLNIKIDVVVNAAASFISKPFLNCTDKDVDTLIDTNLKGAMYTTMATIKHMKSCGRIINIGSVSGLHGIKNQSIYSASKFALRGFSESIGQEFSDILFTTISPGGIDTPLWNEQNPYIGDISKLLKPDDIANTVYYVANCPPNMVVKDITIFPNNEWH